MKNRLLFILFLLIPICLLLWFAYKAQSNEQLASQQQQQNLAYSQLRLIDEKIINYFQHLERTLIAQRVEFEQGLSDSQESFNTEVYTKNSRQLIKYSPYIINIYIADKNEQVIYPSISQALSEKEQSFLSDIQVIINNRSLFMTQNESDIENTILENTVLENQDRTIQDKFKTKSQKIAPEQKVIQYQEQTTTLESGWIAWYQERNLHHLFWFKDDQQRLYLLSLDRIRILSELIALLPNQVFQSLNKSTSSSRPYQDVLKDVLKDVSIKLTNSNNELIYEWGDYSEEDNKSIDIMLSYPLSSWKLSWYAKKLSQSVFLEQWSLVITALSGSFLMLLILHIIYREYTRNIREAQQRVNFVSQVSHELKTPLTNIRMYAELLQEKIEPLDSDEHSQKKSQHFLNVILNESLRLSRLIENVLSFSKVQKHTFKLNMSNNVVDDCIDNVLLSFQPIFERHSLVVHFNKNAGEVISFDAQLLEQILNNLLSNVDKYASGGEKIDITSHQTDNLISIDLRDYGPGIAKNEQDKIFNPFYRSSSKLTEGISGTGIGLTISQHLAALHGGTLKYKSVSRGACFEIRLKPVLLKSGSLKRGDQ